MGEKRGRAADAYALRRQRLGVIGWARNLMAYFFGPYIIGVSPLLLLTALGLRLVGRHGQFLHWWIGLFCEWFIHVFAIDVRVAGLEHIDPDKNYVYVGNHRSWLDVVCLIGMLKPRVKLVFIIKEGLLKIPMFGMFMRGVGYIPVSRATSKKKINNRAQVDRAAEHVRAGKNVLIFPEGTRVPSHRFGKFRRGAADIACAAGVDVMAVSISGTGPLFPRGTPFMRAGPVSLDFHPPISVENRTPDQVLVEMLDVVSGGYRLEADGPPLRMTPEVWAEVTKAARPRR